MTISTDAGNENVSHFSVDLQDQAKKQFEFLRALQKLGAATKCLDEASLEEPICRYLRTAYALEAETRISMHTKWK